MFTSRHRVARSLRREHCSPGYTSSNTTNRPVLAFQRSCRSLTFPAASTPISGGTDRGPMHCSEADTGFALGCIVRREQHVHVMFSLIVYFRGLARCVRAVTVSRSPLSSHAANGARAYGTYHRRARDIETEQALHVCLHVRFADRPSHRREQSYPRISQTFEVEAAPWKQVRASSQQMASSYRVQRTATRSKHMVALLGLLDLIQSRNDVDGDAGRRPTDDGSKAGHRGKIVLAHVVVSQS
ncbi:hypothetical protein EXIGLDRAFT_228279 [Exidia glandulosa HHB12029]|uniref:Uncharacterized protein n=1 Tax=Exidia glandulosa HHB12029 TaxID=1314781 RepID=A0A165K3I8_EXIGL|nr:hypothetical protein EXIGLDRAFT_462568 [Exidia glandulosa HHB12029]KZV99503.1 hypothetical protein EXIGLDRAFT_228279 [Exidia glandulosa HHB12029]